jgi:uncharacterized Zn finger protein (UPF0148 family)
MTSISCPNCKSHISEWDVICLKCGYSVTPEERELLVKEQEAILARQAEQERQAHEAEMKLKHRHRLQKRFDRFTVGTFGISIDIVAVFVIGVILLAAATVLLLM